MKIAQHLTVGRLALDSVNNNSNVKCKIYRKIYLLGNIAPDLNFIYPAHRITTTERRFYKKLKCVTTTKINILRSFELGTLMHYLCDYFCYPHVIESLGLPHRKYECNFSKYFKNNLTKILNNTEDFDLLDISDIKLNCDELMQYIKNIMEQYKENFEKKNAMWTSNMKQFTMDMKYTTAITSNVLKCLIVT